MPRPLRLLIAPALCLALGAQPPSLETRRKALDALLTETWEYNLANGPEFASMIGDKRYNDKLSDRSLEAVERDLKATAAFLKRFEALDPSGFPDQERLSLDLMLRQLRLTLEGARFKDWEMPVAQNMGLHLELPQLASNLAFDTVKDYEDYLARLHQMPRAFDQTVALMRLGMRDGLMPPAFLMPQITAACEAIRAAKPEDSPFSRPLRAFPASVKEADRTRLAQAILKAVATEVQPAYGAFAAFVKDEYAPKGRVHEGIWSLPEGKDRYAFLVRSSTTTELTPAQIHQMGLAEVKRIEGEMLALARKLGAPDLKTFNAAILKNLELRPRSAQDLLDRYTKYIKLMDAKLPELFGRLPRARVVVAPMEAFREKGSAGAEYNLGTPDGSRPGRVMVNTGDFADRLTLNVESTALHEGVPGHHLQIAMAQELTGVPPFRRYGGFTAYIEGWALYSERLGEEVGFYQDPYSFYGHLQDEMERAIRLVVDTGLHDGRWTRQQVVDFFHDHSGIDEVEVQSETDRYIVWPAQALGYKVGQLKILELRAYAKAALGKKFDLRAFHDEVLGAGALPLDLLERRIKAWVARQSG
jgi:uncharacterized protein (DUF885 family)